jgi:hypothetical protein
LGQRPLVPLLLLGPPFFPIILFRSTKLSTGMTGITLHMQWPLTSLSHGSVSQREHFVFLLQIKLLAEVCLLKGNFTTSWAWSLILKKTIVLGQKTAMRLRSQRQLPRASRCRSLTLSKYNLTDLT